MFRPIVRPARSRRIDPLLLVWVVLAVAVLAAEAWIFVHGAPALDPLAPAYVT
jgi:hypothetical protein